VVFGPRVHELFGLEHCQIVISTARHEFFGLGSLEAIRAGAFPVLPRDLAYPELLPKSERSNQRFFYDREDRPTACLARAIDCIQKGEWMPERRELIHFTDRFDWSQLAPLFDQHFDRVAAEQTDAAR
jgi:hypothetical protein